VFEAGDVPRYFYGLPTYKQAKRVAWEALKRLVPREWYETSGRTFYESDLKIRTRYGVELHVVGLDTPQRIEGNQWCGGILDECSDQQPKVFDMTVQPALTAYNGWCWRIGVPKRYGIGAEDFKRAFDYGLTSSDPDYETYHWPSSTVLDPEELEKIKAVLDPRDFSEQYDANWEQTSGAIFYTFSEHKHVKEVQYDPTQRICVGSDFNVNPMCWVLCHDTGTGLNVFDELKLNNTNTQETLDILFARYGAHPGGWDFYGDASSKSRKTSASSTDYIQIYNDKRFISKKVYYFDSNPLTVDRFAACNALLSTASGLVRTAIHPRCTRLLADLKHRAYKEGSRDAADSGEMGHMSDAWGYIVCRKYPLLLQLDTRGSVVCLS
jgi:hypothetical protein